MRFSTGIVAVVVWSGIPFASSAIHGQTELSKVPPKDWKANEVLRLSVEKWSLPRNGTKAAKPAATYSVDVRHLTNPTAEDPWWILQFEPPDSAPKILRASCSAWILKDKGWISKVRQWNPGISEQEDKEVLSINGASALVRPIAGLPLELLPPTLSKNKYVTDRATVELLREDDGDAVIMVAVINIRGQDQVQITQTWKKGERWWREYTREINGRKDLHARFVSVLSVEQAAKEKALRADCNAFVSWDKRLAVKVNVFNDNPKLSDLVAVVQKASGVTLTVEDSLRGYVPDFGSCQFRDCPAWVIVNFIANHGYHKAKWENHKSGYRLTLATTMTDAGLKNLPDPDDLTVLNLFSSQVTNAGLKELARFKNLTTLDLGNTKVTDVGLRDLARLKTLTALDLHCTQVTNTGLKELAGLHRLVSLDLSRTRVTDAGVAQLRKVLPGCYIRR
jgi:Leucine Rich Repeat (LRR) protein